MVDRLVYCTKCGAENEDDAAECASCGEPLRRPIKRYRRRFEDDLCFGSSGGTPVVGILFGLLIVLWGLSSLMGRVFHWFAWGSLWPLFVIALGLLILYNAFSRR